MRLGDVSGRPHARKNGRTDEIPALSREVLHGHAREVEALKDEDRRGEGSPFLGRGRRSIRSEAAGWNAFVLKQALNVCERGAQGCGVGPYEIQPAPMQRVLPETIHV